MFAWLRALFSSDSTQQVVLILQPDESARSLPGFHTGQPLRLVGSAGETVGDLLARFNTYRGPDAQITRLYTAAEGTPLSLAAPVQGTLTAIVRGKENSR